MRKFALVFALALLVSGAARADVAVCDDVTTDEAKEDLLQKYPGAKIAEADDTARKNAETAYNENTGRSEKVDHVWVAILPDTTIFLLISRGEECLIGSGHFRADIAESILSGGQ